MIGIGKWRGYVSTMFFKGDTTFTIEDDNGNYKVDLELPSEIDVPEFSFSEIQGNGNILTAIATSPKFPGKKIDIELTFDGDNFDGLLKVPYIGKVKIKDGKKIG